MGRRPRDYDIGGIKLFGRCRTQGTCVCGRCLDAPINQVDQVKITQKDGTVTHMQAPAVPTPREEAKKFNHSAWPTKPVAPEHDQFDQQMFHALEDTPEPEYELISERGDITPIATPLLEPPAPVKPERNQARCPDCKKYLRKNHKCKYGSGQNGPVEVLPPAAEVSRELAPNKHQEIMDLSGLRHNITIKIGDVEITVRPMEAKL